PRARQAHSPTRPVARPEFALGARKRMRRPGYCPARGLSLRLASMSALPQPLIAPGVLDLIGRTPLVELTRFAVGPCHLFAKLENQNPAGSIKDRIALTMIAG